MRLIIFIVAIIFSSCKYEEPKIIIKKIKTDDIKLKWYYYSYISTNSPEYILVEKKGEKKIIFEGEAPITDVTINKHDIIIKLADLSHGIVNTNHLKKNVFNYNIVLDRTGTIEELWAVPDGIRESTW